MSIRHLVALIVASALVFGCQKETDSATEEAAAEPQSPDGDSPKTDTSVPSPDAPPTVHATGSKTDAGDLFARVAKDLPADTFAIALVDVDGILGSELLTAVINGDDATRKAVHADLSAHFDQHLGLDLTNIEWMAGAVGDGMWGALIVGGDISLDGLEDGDIPGTKTLKVGGLLALPLGSGFAVVPDQKSAEALLAAKQSPLADSDNMKSLQSGLAGVPAGPVMVVARNAPLLAMVLNDLPPEFHDIHTAAASLAGGVHVVVTASPEAVNAMKGVVEKFRGELMAELDRAYATRSQAPFEEGVLAILAKHNAPGLFDQLSPRFDGNTASLSLEMGSSAGVTVAVVGMLAAIAVPAFSKYVRRSKDSESYENLKSIADGAMMYFMEEHMAPDSLDVTTGVYPIAVTPICTAGNLDGEKVAPIYTDWSQWEDLRFQINRPHFFQYCYVSSADGSAFAASAKASLGGSGEVDSYACIKGTSAGGSPELGRLEELAPGTDCLPTP